MLLRRVIRVRPVSGSSTPVPTTPVVEDLDVLEKRLLGIGMRVEVTTGDEFGLER